MILAKPLAQQRSLSGKLWMIPTSLSHNAGIITALIGSTTYSCTLSGLVANTRYQLYVVPGSTTLQFSTRENSLGPIGFSNWILIGSFYANGLSSVSFGSFVNIDGKPKTRDQVNWLPTGVLTSNIGYSSNSAWWRDGAVGIFQASASFSGDPGAFSNLSVNTPTNIVMNTNSAILSEVAGGANIIGVSYFKRGSNNWVGEILFQGASTVVTTSRRVQGSYIDMINVTNTVPTANFANTDGMFFKWSPPAIVGWTDTPLKDL